MQGGSGGAANVSSTGSRSLANEEVLERIEKARSDLGEAVVVLGHHYQVDEVVRFADHVGDSLELSRAAASCREAAYIVFCGVDFMAESAALLCGEEQTVVLPSEAAICPMAGMADVAAARIAWRELAGIWGEDVIPVTYQNSSAGLKAFCGEHGGAVCTSSNAAAVFRWALEQKGHLLFFPDEHLGRNTALSLGLEPEEIGVWERERSPQDLSGWEQMRVVVWNGYCHVHTFFSEEQVDAARASYPGARVIVHPECPAEVVARADGAGSTSYMVKAVREAPAGSTFVMGTEVNLVQRLASEHPHKSVVPLAHSVCDAMSEVTPLHLLTVLEDLREGRVSRPVDVQREVRGAATIALDRMLAVT
jgi:quinolinate synthase